MTSIRAGWDALEKHVPASLKVSGVYYVTQSAAVRMSCLIQDLLQLANSGRPNRKLELAAIEPNSFCLQRYEKYEIYARQQRHPLRFKIEEAMTQIGSIFITNAVAHTRMIPLSISTANFKKRCCRNRGVQLWRRRCRTGFSANFRALYSRRPKPNNQRPLWLGTFGGQKPGKTAIVADWRPQCSGWRGHVLYLYAGTI